MVFYLRKEKESGEYNVAEIELYWADNEYDTVRTDDNGKTWSTSKMHLDCHFSLYTEGIIRWCRENLDSYDNGELAVLMQDFRELEDVRLYLWEKSGIQSRFRQSKSDKEDSALYKEIYDYIDNKIRSFADIHGFTVVID